MQRHITKASLIVAFADGTTSTIAQSDIAEVVRRMCEMCQVAEALKQERFCKECRKLKLAELKEGGYLQPVPFMGDSRSGEQRENTRETKLGVDDNRIMPDPRNDF